MGPHRPVLRLALLFILSLRVVGESLAEQALKSAAINQNGESITIDIEDAQAAENFAPGPEATIDVELQTAIPSEQSLPEQAAALDGEPGPDGDVLLEEKPVGVVGSSQSVPPDFEIEEISEEEYNQRLAELNQPRNLEFRTLAKLREAAAPITPSFLKSMIASFDNIMYETFGFPEASCLFFLAASIFLTLFFAMKLLWDGLGREKRDTILIMGPTDSGKTCLFYRLIHGRLPATVTSMKPHVGRYYGGAAQGPGGAAAGGGGLRVVALPGHQRLRGLEGAHLARAAGVVFVVDAAALAAGQLAPAAEALFDLLTDPGAEAAARRGFRALVACNKADRPAAKRAARCRALVVRELEALRRTRATLSADLRGGGGGDAVSGGRGAAVAAGGGLGGGGGGAPLPLGREGEPLDLDRDAPFEVAFAGVSVAQGELGPVEAFLEDYL